MTDSFILVVASTNACMMDFFDTSTGERVGRITDLVLTPHEIWPDLARRRVYMVSAYRTGAYGSPDKSHEVTIVDVDKYEVVDVIDISPFVAPHDIEYSPVHDLIYASVEPAPDGDNGLVMIDPKNHRVIGNIPTEGKNSHWMTLTPDGARAYVAHKETPFLSVIDLEKQEVAETIPVPGGAEEIMASPDGRSVFVNTPTLNMPITLDELDSMSEREAPPTAVLKVDTSTNTIVGSCPLEPHISALSVTANNDVLVSQLLRHGDALLQPSGARNGTVRLISGETMKQIGSAELERGPFTSRSTPDGSTAYVTNLLSGTISVVDLPSLTIRDTWVSTPPTGPAPGGSHGLALFPR